jgi:hypothetical protein
MPLFAVWGERAGNLSAKTDLGRARLIQQSLRMPSSNLFVLGNGWGDGESHGTEHADNKYHVYYGGECLGDTGHFVFL